MNCRAQLPGQNPCRKDLTLPTPTAQHRMSCSTGEAGRTTDAERLQKWKLCEHICQVHYIEIGHVSRVASQDGSQAELPSAEQSPTMHACVVHMQMLLLAHSFGCTAHPTHNVQQNARHRRNAMFWTYVGLRAGRAAPAGTASMQALECHTPQ